MSSPSSSAVVCSMKKKESKKTIYLCDDFLYDIFPNVGNVRLGLGMALISYDYDAVVDDYFKRKKRKLGRLWIRRTTEMDASKKKGKNVFKSSELIANGKKVPFAETPLQKGIVGFKSISISFVDENAVAFLEKFRTLLDKGIAFKCDGFNLCGKRYAYQKKKFCKIWSLFRDNIVKMVVTYDFLEFLCRLFGPTVLRECANLRFVNAEPIHLWGAPRGDAFFKWLHTAREDGRPKVLTMDGRPAKYKIDVFKKEFLKATSAVSFIVRFCTVYFLNDDMELEELEFELTNEWTDEKLTLRCVEDNGRKNLTAAKHFGNIKFEIWVLERGPIKREEKLWIEWAKEGPFNTDYWEENNVVYVNLDDQRQLGPIQP